MEAHQASGPGGVQAAHWYAVQTRYRFERKVTVQLKRKGLETFLPVLEEIHNWSDRRQAVDVPLFSGYSFIRFDLASPLRLEILRTEGVLGLISFGGEAIAIPSREIEDIRMLLSQKTPCALHAFLKIGQRVRIRGGCLHGLEGILEQSAEKNIVISIACIERSIMMKIEGYGLEMI